MLDSRNLTFKDGHGVLAERQGLMFCHSLWRGLIGTGLSGVVQELRSPLGIA